MNEIQTAAALALRRATGPVPRSEYPDAAVAATVARIATRAAYTGVVEVTDDDRRYLAGLAAAMRPPHPFTLA